MEKEIVQRAVSRLANTMRIYGEEHLRYKSLVAVDKEEAIENLDRAWEAKLEAFHTLYDVSKDEFDYFAQSDTSLLIALRNALHHRDHSLFSSLLPELWLCEAPERLEGAAFLLASHKFVGGEQSRMHHFIKLDDIYSRLDPSKNSPELLGLGKTADLQKRFNLIAEGLTFMKIQAEAKSERYPEKQVYLDIMPIFISGVVRVFRALKSLGVEFKGYDARAYEKCFTEELEIDLSFFEFKILRMNMVQLYLGPALTVNEAAILYGRKIKSCEEDSYFDF
ncbi:hypothetical protein G7009_23015 [Pseudomonas capeferrum]|uniref:hypothetical protein n=1 Tax=Pseudomonas capeferrum TaxID=1495066 RepID=UPI0015E2C0B5|nr:hypothetical protein [Pseudomonas capeferrum]MBA1204591.1 hypothetical protein [Pseudomonas capeferrum]